MAAVLLAALLGIAAYGDASAMAMRDAAGQMVICTGTGPVTIYVDAEGRPAAPPHPCPDCISLTLDAGLAAPRLLYPAVQFNMRGGQLPPPEDNGVSYFKTPINRRSLNQSHY